ncbi:GFA family protein [Streptomyces sp. BE133]|uniref:GFA family protein n=1 Tax=Streptomyces sp. BE133 TaxID=3002523 RepID=UPI002E75E2D6|nr:GFA family protein [Streptomyces sp. BE133]MEE1806725.1 GFA family protein [Streptomyces sp. BE133]
MTDNLTPEVFTGGCLCGHIRFEATGEPYDPRLCSCPHCARLSGGPLMGWVGFRRSAFTWTGPGIPASFRSWPTMERWFCPACGTPLGAAGHGEDYLGICLSALDNCAEIIPIGHSFRDKAPAWLAPIPSTQPAS